MPNVTLIIVLSAIVPIVMVVLILGALMRGQQKTDQLLQTGTPARGRILQLGTTGGSVAVMGHRHLKLVLTVEVHPQMGPPYVATFEQLVSELQIPSVQPGASIELRVDPQNPSRMAMASVGGPPPGMQQPQQGAWGTPGPGYGPQPGPGYGPQQPMGQAMGPQGFPAPIAMGVAQPNYKRALPFTLIMIFITTVPTAAILLYVFGGFGGFFSSSSSTSKDSDDETEDEKPTKKKSKSGNTCVKAAKCCRVIAQGNDTAIKACDNVEQMPEVGCQQSLDAYKQSAKAMNKTCD